MRALILVLTFGAACAWAQAEYSFEEKTILLRSAIMRSFHMGEDGEKVLREALEETR